MTIFAAETTKDQTYDDEKAIYDISPEGKMECEKMSDAVYDENGYLQSIVTQIGGKRTITNTTFIWENGRVKTQILVAKI